MFNFNIFKFLAYIFASSLSCKLLGGKVFYFFHISFTTSILIIIHNLEVFVEGGGNLGIGKLQNTTEKIVKFGRLISQEYKIDFKNSSKLKVEE